MSNSKVPVPPALRPLDNVGADVFQREVREAIRKLSIEPILNNSVKTATILATGTKIAHGLGRVPVGWELTDKTANADVWRTSWDSKFAFFTSSATVTVSIRFH